MSFNFLLRYSPPLAAGLLTSELKDSIYFYNLAK